MRWGRGIVNSRGNRYNYGNFSGANVHWMRHRTILPYELLALYVSENVHVCPGDGYDVPRRFTSFTDNRACYRVANTITLLESSEVRAIIAVPEFSGILNQLSSRSLSLPNRLERGEFACEKGNNDMYQCPGDTDGNLTG